MISCGIRLHALTEFLILVITKLIGISDVYSKVDSHYRKKRCLLMEWLL